MTTISNPVFQKDKKYEKLTIETNLNRFYFVGGASGSGKTTVIPDIKKILGNSISAYDFDEIGVPQDADKKWRQKSTEAWLQRLLQENKTVCLFGQIVLGEILACPSAKQIGKIHFYLLDVNDFERIQRLKTRGTSVDQHTLNWAAWLRVHHRDPQWMQSVLKEHAWDELNFSTWDHLANWKEKAVVKYLNTTHLSIQQTARFIATWIQEDADEFRHFG